MLIFGGIVFFSFKSILISNLDQTLYNGGKILEESLTDYALKSDDDPNSLADFSEEDGGKFIGNIDEEVNETFVVKLAYGQLLIFPQGFTRTPPIIAKTATLHDRTLPFSQDAYQNIRESPYFSETITDVFAFPLRVLSLQVHNRDGQPYILQLALSLQEVETILHELLLILAILFPVLLIILTFVGHGFMKYAFSPVRKMVAITQQITAEDLSLRIDQYESRDEIGELAATLNDMIDRLERSFKQITQFSGDVAHELKTPLAELKCNTEVTLRRERSSQEYQEALQNVIEDVARLHQIVEDLLLLAKMDAQSLSGVFVPVALNEVFLEVFEYLHPLVQKKKLAVNFEKIEPIAMIGDSRLLKRLLSNLITNAIQYTPSGGEITFVLHQQDDQAMLSISDTGSGIPEEHLPYIFDRFYRVEQSRSYNTGGSGLGLAIAYKIVELHNGAVFVQSHVGHGTTVLLSFPNMA